MASSSWCCERSFRFGVRVGLEGRSLTGYPRAHRKRLLLPHQDHAEGFSQALVEQVEGRRRIRERKPVSNHPRRCNGSPAEMIQRLRRPFPSVEGVHVPADEPPSLDSRRVQWQGILPVQAQDLQPPPRLTISWACSKVAGGAQQWGTTRQLQAGVEYPANPDQDQRIWSCWKGA